MPAINFLSTATIPSIALHNVNASSFPFPINNVGNSSAVLIREKRDNNSNAHEMAYSAHNRRLKRNNQSCGKMKKEACKPRRYIESADDFIARMEICIAVRNCKEDY